MWDNDDVWWSGDGAETAPDGRHNNDAVEDGERRDNFFPMDNI